MAVRIEPVPAWPFAEWLQARVQCWTERGESEKGCLRRVCMECGWDGESGLRKLYRYRHMQRGTSIKDQRRRFKHRKVDINTTTFPRGVVEEALHHADVDFMDLYIEYAHRFEGEPGRPRDVLNFVGAYWELADELMRSANPWHREAYCVPCGERTLRDDAGACHWCAGEREFKAKLAKLAKMRADAAKRAVREAA
jgi:hypothetical protein